MKRKISDKQWQLVEQAFVAYTYRKRQLKASKASRKKDDPTSWHTRQTKIVKALESAMKQIQIARSNEHGNFLDEASENHSLENFRRSYRPANSARVLLEEAYEKLLCAVTIIERAEPVLVEVASDAESRRMLARDLKAALIRKGERGFRTTDASLAGHIAEADMKPFEKLLSAWKVHEAATPYAFVIWLRRALKEPKQG